MAGIYNREALFQRNIVDRRTEIDMGSLDIPELTKSKDKNWTIVRYGEKCRPDLIAYRVYGDQDLWWVIPWMNGIADPWHDLVENVALWYLPLDRVQNAIKNKRMRGA